MIMWKRQSYSDRKQIGACQELAGRERGRVQRDTREFGGMMEVFYALIVLVVVTRRGVFVKICPAVSPEKGGFFLNANHAVLRLTV